MSVSLTGHLICTTEDQAATVQRHLPDHIRLSRAEPGCLAFEVAQIAPLIWQVRESFATRADFDAHQTRTRASDWFRLTSGIAREYEIAEDQAGLRFQQNQTKA